MKDINWNIVIDDALLALLKHVNYMFLSGRIKCAGVHPRMNKRYYPNEIIGWATGIDLPKYEFGDANTLAETLARNGTIMGKATTILRNGFDHSAMHYVDIEGSTPLSKQYLDQLSGSVPLNTTDKTV